MADEHANTDSAINEVVRILKLKIPPADHAALDSRVQELVNDCGDPHSEHVREVFQAMDNPSIVIIDEFDRVAGNGVETDLADTIKTLADNSIETTLIVVGLADSLNQLIKEHRSIQRAIREIRMPRMSKAELT
jgi:Cdc6-like AAA superfamily ATPase